MDKWIVIREFCFILIFKVFVNVLWYKLNCVMEMDKFNELGWEWMVFSGVNVRLFVSVSEVVYV